MTAKRRRPAWSTSSPWRHATEVLRQGRRLLPQLGEAGPRVLQRQPTGIQKIPQVDRSAGPRVRRAADGTRLAIQGVGRRRPLRLLDRAHRRPLGCPGQAAALGARHPRADGGISLLGATAGGAHTARAVCCALRLAASVEVFRRRATESVLLRRASLAKDDRETSRH